MAGVLWQVPLAQLLAGLGLQLPLQAPLVRLDPLLPRIVQRQRAFQVVQVLVPPGARQVGHELLRPLLTAPFAQVRQT